MKLIFDFSRSDDTCIINIPNALRIRNISAGGDLVWAVARAQAISGVEVRQLYESYRVPRHVLRRLPATIAPLTHLNPSRTLHIRALSSGKVVYGVGMSTSAAVPVRN